MGFFSNISNSIKRAISRLLGKKVEDEIVRRGTTGITTSEAAATQPGTGIRPTASPTSAETGAGFAFDRSKGIRNLVNQWAAIPRNGKQQILTQDDFQNLGESDRDFLLNLDTRYEEMTDNSRARIEEILKKMG
jgi:hypothetical protein